MANSAEATMGSEGDVNIPTNITSASTETTRSTEVDSQTKEESDANILLAHATSRHKSNDLSPADIRNVLSANTRAPKTEEIVLNGKKYFRTINTTHIVYDVSKHHIRAYGSQIDWGANGGCAGEDVTLIACHVAKTVHVYGIDNHEVNNVPLATVGAYTETQ